MSTKRKATEGYKCRGLELFVWLVMSVSSLMKSMEQRSVEEPSVAQPPMNALEFPWRTWCAFL